MTGHNDSDSSDVTGAATDTPAMLMVDQKSRWLRGDRVLVEEYCQRIPSLRNHAESLLDLIYSEVLLRERYGEQPKLAEYVEQFPHLADQLRVQFELDQAMYSWNTSNERTRSATNPDNVLEHIGERGMGPVEVVREQLPIGLVTVAGRQPTTTTTDLQSLLHKRLRFIALLFLVGITIMVVGGLLRVMTYGGNLLREVWLQFYFLIFAVGGLITYVLWGRRSLSVLQLRMLELVLFGGMFLLWAGVDAFIYPQFHLATPPVWFRFMMANAVSLPWALMIILYGIFIPNTWPRCAAVVGIMAFTPIVISTATGLSIDVAEGYSRWKFLIGLAAWMAIASAMAIYGSHRIETLRQQVLAARRLGQYQLKQRLGAGGMGEVYLAEHVLLRRPCALKLIRPERAGDAKYLRRFEREVQATAALTHPNTVQVFDYGHAEDGTFYFAMEYLPGLTLQELVDRHGPVPAERAVHLLRQVCGALAEAHAAGLIHRDVKPANVIVCNRGGLTDVAKLLDFGLVRSLNSEAGVTLDREVTGTPTYMSPEQAAGGEVVDARSDIYAVGGLAYFLLTGRPPFADRTAVRVLAAHLYEAPEPPTKCQPDIPADLEAVVLRCLAKSPADRFCDAASLNAALAGCVGADLGS